MASTREQAGSGGSAGGARPDRALVQTVATVVAAMFLLVGILGFVPGITTQYGDMGLAGHGSMAELLGVFRVSVLHNLIHLAFGVVGLAMARSALAARAYLLVGGTGYLVVWVYGLVVDQGSSANFVPLNTPDNWLHFVLGVGMVSLGTVLNRRSGTNAELAA